MKVSKNSKYQTHEEPKRPKWRTKCPLPRVPGALKGGPFCIFQHPLLQNIEKLKGDPLVNFFSEKSQCRKNWKGDLFVSPGIVCYAEKEEKPFWFSSLGQMIQFGTIKIRRTFRNYFDQFVWIERKKSH